MGMTIRRAIGIAALLGFGGTAALAAGDLAIKGQKLPDLEIGTGNAGYGISQKKYDLETGKAYRLKLKGTGKQECKLRGPEFFSAIYIRQIAAGEVEIMNPTFSGFEFDDPSEAELYFVPVRTGKFTIACAGLEAKGMTVEFEIK
jgi:hypothetical protein